jgi:hypothetical protein
MHTLRKVISPGRPTSCDNLASGCARGGEEGARLGKEGLGQGGFRV